MATIQLQPQIWKEEYVVNISTIDAHNRNFFEVMNFMIDTINCGKCSENIAEIFFKLTYYIENYLIDEELYCKEYSYPKFNEHKEAHNQFVNRVTQFETNYATDPESVCVKLVEYLEEWFENHMIKQDQEVVKFLLEKGVK